jgi:hypothetical protein
LKYSFNPRDFNNLKGRIAEKLVQYFIEKAKIPALTKKGWDYVFFRRMLPTDLTQDDLPPLRYAGGPFQNINEKFFVGHGLFPSRKLLTRIKKLSKLLEQFRNESGDGFLIKTRKTGETRTLKEALDTFGLGSFRDGSWSFEGCEFVGSEHKNDEQLPIVNGEIEIVEVKSGTGYLHSEQKECYRKILQEGYALRFFRVNIVSFKRNEFEIQEKLITSPDQLKTFPLK